MGASAEHTQQARRRRLHAPAGVAQYLYSRRKALVGGDLEAAVARCCVAQHPSRERAVAACVRVCVGGRGSLCVLFVEHVCCVSL